MKYFLDSAKIEEIKEAYHTFGIDGVTTNPRHIMVSGKPFLTVISEMADWVKAEGIEGYEKFPISVEINPHLDDADEMVAEARKISAICSNFVIKIPCTEAGIQAARRLEAEGIRTNVTLVFSPAQAILPAKNNSLLFHLSSAGKRQMERIVKRTFRLFQISMTITDIRERHRLSVRLSVHLSRL